MRRFACFTAIIIAITTVSFLVTDDPVRELYKKAEMLQVKYPREKVYLHFDKPYYSTGDTIFFKAYILNAEHHLPSELSSILYVDLLDQKDSVRESLILPVSDGISAGTIPLTDSVEEGAYRIRAYTRWMRNLGEDYFFDKHISIGDALNNDISMQSVITADEKNSGKDQALLQYHFYNGRAVAGKEVSYTLFNGTKEIAKGNGRTDTTGELILNLAKYKFNNTERNKLVTQIKTDNKKTITRSVYFNHSPARADVLFFPEGGQMVSGLPATIGFKAIDQQGNSIHVTGKVLGKDDVLITRFESGFAGLGRFQLLPDHEEDYYALVKFDDGTEKKIALPKALERGYTLSVQNADTDKLNIRIGAVQASDEDLILVAQSNNTIEYVAKNKPGASGIFSVLSKKRFPTGILQLTLFTAALEPVAERLVFINNHDQLKVKLSADKPVYNKREKVQLVLSVKDPDDEVIRASFSMAVTDQSMTAFNPSDESSILSEILLTSDVKGNIEHPGYYFAADNIQTRTDLDNLLLTQGWRRFSWKDILAGKIPSFPYSVEKTLAISGTVKSAKDEPMPGRRVMLMAKDGSDLIFDAMTDDKGKFIFDSLSYTGTMNFSIQSIDPKGNNDVTITIDKIPFQQVTKSSNAVSINNPALLNYLNSSNKRFTQMRKYGQLDEKGKTLKEVIVNGKKSSKLEEAVAPSMNLNGAGKADQVLTYEDLRNCGDLGMCLQGKLTGVTFKYIFDSANRRRDIIPYSTRGYDRPMLILFDGIEMNSKMGGLTLSTISPSTIQSIEVLRSGPYLASYGTQAAGGVIIITSKRGGIDYDPVKVQDKKEKIKGIVFSSAKGYSQIREFYSPSYQNAKSNKNIPDLRSTIFWKPNIIIDEDGKAIAGFYTADTPGAYRIVVEGIADNGKIGRQVYTINVQ